MKKTFIVLASLMVMICMICSCGGSGSGSASAEDVVAVRLGVNINDDTQGMIGVNGQSLDDATFWYKAHAQWTGTDFTTPQGDTGDTWTELTAFSMADYDEQTVGYFAQGSWKFEVQVTLGDTADENVLYQTKALANISPVYVNANSTQFEITVDKVIDEDVDGTITFDIDVPEASATDKLVIKYYPIDTPTAEATVTLDSSAAQSPIDRESAAGIVTFSTDALDIPSGFYIVTATYSTYESSTWTETRSQTVTAEIVAGGDTTVSGTLENGVWKSTSFTIKGIKSITATVAAQQNPTYKVATEVTFTCTATPSGFTNPTITYEWRVGGAVQAGKTTSTFAYTPSAAGDDYVTCIAYVKEGGKTVVSASNTVKFSVQP